MSILVLRFSALGDVAMTLPVIYSVAETYPDETVYVATRAFFARMFVNPPANVKVIPFDLKAPEYKGLKGTLRIARELAGLKPDYVADLHNMARTLIISAWLRMCGAKVAIVDKSRASRSKVMQGGPEQRQYIDRYFDVFRKLGFPASVRFRSIYEGFQPALPGGMTVRHPAVGIAPFARYATKTYPPEKMLAVARMLSGRGINVYLFGGRGEEASQLENWQAEATVGKGSIVSVAGKYPLTDELAIMHSLDLMVSMDSANQHLAALTGIPVITLWGSTTPACGFMPFGQPRDNSLCLALPCQPCNIAGSPRCAKGHFDCMNKLSPEMIVNKVISLL